MVKRIVFKGILAMGLIFVLGLSSCSDNVLEVKTGKIANPIVTAEPISAGVKLSWNPILEAYEYVIWREGGSQTGAVMSIVDSPDSDGVCVFFDIVNDSNNIESNTEYTYTVIASAISSTLDDGRWEGKVTTGAIPARGTKIASPSDVSMELDIEEKTITVSITPSASGIIPSEYIVDLSLPNGVNGNGDWDSSTTYIYNITGNLIEGEYKADVYGDVENSDTYFVKSDVKTASVKFEALFGQGEFDINPAEIAGTGASSDTITGIRAELDLSGLIFKYGVSYKFQRAQVVGGITGSYADVTLRKQTGPNAYTNLVAADLIPDVLGNMPELSVYDESASEGKYIYRIAAEKADAVDYRYADTSFYYSDFANVGLSVVKSATPTTGSETYVITPTINYKNALQDGAKVEVYYAINDISDAQIGYYKYALAFSKDELEAQTVQSKNLAVGENSDSNDLYVIAFLVFADGTQKSLNWSGSAIDSGGSGTGEFDDPNDDTKTISYAQLDY